MLASSPTQAMIRKELAGMMYQLMQGEKAITPAGPYNSGPGGIFNLPQVERQFVSLVVQPTGLAATLPNYPDMFANPEFGYITGFGGLTGTRANDICADARIPGSVINCIQTAHYGMARLDTKPIALNRVGLMNNRADPTDFTLLNGPLWPMVRNLMPQNVQVSNYASWMFNPRMEMLARMGDVAREYYQILGEQFWYGDPADPAKNSTTGTGENEFKGMSYLINTTKLDARTGTPCNALKSDIKNFNSWDITRNSGKDFFNALYYMVQTRKFIAKRTNMGEVTWVIACREAMWNEIAKMWPCVAATFGCLPGPEETTITPVISLDNQAAMRQAMLDDPQITIAGTRIKVVIDDFLQEESIGNGCYRGDLWLLATEVKSGVPTIFMQHLDYNQGAIPAAQQMGMSQIFRTDNGTFLWWSKPNNNVCVQAGSMTEQRVVNLVPHLCGRLDDIGYCALQHGPDPLRGQPYYDATGEGSRGIPAQLYDEAHLTGPGIHTPPN